MRGSLHAFCMLAATVGVGVGVDEAAAAFDRPLCDELRRQVDNADLARRVSSDPPGGDLECLVRIAAVRLSADEAVYETDSLPLMTLALRGADLESLDTLETRRTIATHLRTAADPFITDAVYRSGLTIPARNDLFAQLASKNFLDAETMLVPGAEPPASPPPVEGLVELAALATPGCLAPDAADDPDIARNAEAVDDLCVTRETVSDGEASWSFVTVANADSPAGPVWYVPHDDEDAAFDAALHAVRTYGGKVVAVAADERHEVDGRDPNRAFGADPDDVARCDDVAASPNYTAFVSGLFAETREVLTLHNNPDGGAISARVRTAKLRGWRARRGSFRDPDNLVTIAGTTSFGRSREARRLRDRLLGAGLNVVYEQVTERNNDCSLSNYVMLNGAKPYFNLEAETGSERQDDMVDALMKVLGHAPVGLGGRG